MAYFNYYFYLCLLIASSQANPTILDIIDSKVDVSATQVEIAPGESTQVTCTPGGSPLPSVQWRKYQGEFGKGTTQNGNALIISNAVTSDSGDYICLGVIDRKAIAQNYVTVEVKENLHPKNVKVSQKILTIKKGQNGTIDCIPEGTPEPQIQWRKADGRLSDQAKQVGNSLVITNAQVSDAGDYVCYAVIESTPVFNDYARIVVEDVTPITPPQPQTQVGSSRVTVTERQIRIPRGGSGSVECKPEGSPLPRVQWTKVGGSFGKGTWQGGNSLVITNAADSAQGDYVCTAIVAGTPGQTAYLRVLIEDATPTTPQPPSPTQAGSPRVTVSERRIKISRGESYSVECNPEGSPLPRVQWTKAGGWFGEGTRQDGNTLVITDARDGDEGDYVCTAIVAGTPGQTAYLRVEIEGEETARYRPEHLPKPLDVPVVEGYDITISCDFQTGDDEQVVTWSRLDQHPLSHNTQQSGRELVIRRAVKDNAGEYLCRVTGGGYLLRQLYVRLAVNPGRRADPPRVVVRPETSRAARGQALVVQCEVVAGEDVRVTWERVGGSLSSRAENRGEQLVFRNIQVEDGGSYRCLARNHDGETAQTTQIEVEDVTPTTPPQPQTGAGSPRVTVSERQIKVARGGSYSVECKPEGSPLPRAQWTKAGGWFGKGTRQDGNTLVITDARDDDEGDYVCTAIVAGTPGQTAYLRVEIEDATSTTPPQPQTGAGNPRVTVSERQIKVARGGSYSVECKPEGSPLPRAQWTKAGGWFGEGTRQDGNTLVITDARDGDEGDYVCTAIVAGTPGQTAYLRVEIEDVTPTTQSQSQAGSPRVTIQETEVRIPRGGSRNVECNPEGTPLPRVQWTKAGGWFGEGTRQDGNTLVITDARDDDEGDYVCTAIVAGTPGQTAYLRVLIEDEEQDTPTVEVSEQQVKVKKGESVRVLCSSTSSPPPTIHWTKESGTFGSGTRQEGDDLVITSADEGDAGQYFCYAVVDEAIVNGDSVTVEVEDQNEIDNSICSLPKETSWCITSGRWYYDSAEHICTSFSWGECPANANSFESEEACNLACEGV